eukprot:TRINITY_DN20061_c0_g1_i2.p1 TRINITY_DN20061_c0_g1~~TRINITY_DN20061_c0_g1_i2.p1  ORF type:complete len:495 (+),score=133.13 TRINITY_DN20061_c0_g1_i2:74-1558(+)
MTHSTLVPSMIGLLPATAVDAATFAYRQLADRFSGKMVTMILLGAFTSKLLWSQYSVLLDRRCPPLAQECPVLGCVYGWLRWDYVNWSRHVMKQAPALLTQLFFVPSVLVSWPVYEKHVKKADNGGQLHQGNFPEYMNKLLGEHSMLLMQAGKGCAKHHRLRQKVLASMAPRRVLALQPDMERVCRDILDRLVADTEKNGFAKFLDYTQLIPKRITAIPILGGAPPELKDKLSVLMDAVIDGFFAFPLNLGEYSALGRAMKAKEKMNEVIEDLMAHTDEAKGSVLADLAAVESDGSAGFSHGEIVDTIITLLFAGQFTTAEALPPLMVELSKRPEWAAKVAAEPMELEQVEGDSVTVRFVRECLRHYPPEVLFVRQNKTCPMSLGEHGEIPKGCNVVMNFGDAMWQLGSDFDPDRWTHSVVHDSFLTFGGTSPHSCVGRSIAMVELQIFARIMCREYEVEVLDDTRVRNWEMLGMFRQYKDGCRVKVTRKKAAA